ncbi:SDR family NAD(P)-dependent oxidoreductase [Lentzea sp. DG1S-22]|uniref:SDR family NAD(P)-dependent oxidoreductase n=1 Tax=Lentzea sp. DG1S-22 TaxID=3108822 RepID=UPI002E784A66|nr:SDR family NAD(P)-dependent oxidoreductase [Lentzea sp. DG1S-22]WVH82418.1 SDR family NAD(P)-dependent oxidoreductase [Lentzea sp. DG1S-22]
MSDAIVLNPDLVGLFARASSDHNPLHTSVEYARATAFGRPVSHGALAVLAVLGRLPMAVSPSRVHAVFRDAVYPDAPHHLTVAANEDGYRGDLWAHGQRVLTASVQSGVAPPPASNWPSPPDAPSPMRQAPRALTLDEIEEGMEFSGWYTPAHLDELAFRLGLDRAVLPVATAMCWASYLAGMEVPGRQGLLASLTVTAHEHRPVPRYRYLCKVTSVDRRFGAVRVQGRLWADQRPAAEVRLETFFRPSARVVGLSETRAALPAGGALRGRVAVVIGASRGLGAATTLALAEQGCTVVGVHHMSTARAAELGRHRRIEMHQGDASDSGFCHTLAKHVRETYGRTDFLVCSAGPVLRPTRLTAETTELITGHVTAAMRLVAIPVAAFSPLLDASSGTLLVVSSQVLDNPGPEWPHHAAAKAALEHLVRAQCPAHPDWRVLLARLPSLDTDLSTPLTVLQRERRASPAAAAATLVTALHTPRAPGCALLEFDESGALR